MRKRVIASPRLELADALEPVVDLASGDLVGWALPVNNVAGSDAQRLIRAARARLPSGHILAAHLTSTTLESCVGADRLWGSDSLHDLAVVAAGDLSSEAIILLERLRERGAQVGCDSESALQHVARLRPDFLWLSEELGGRTQRNARGSIGPALLAMAQSLGGRLLASRTTLGGAMAVSSLDNGFPARACFPDLAALAEPLRSVPAAAPLSRVVDICLSDDDQDWLVLVDDEARPARLVERLALLREERFEHPVCEVDRTMSLDAATHRAVSRAVRDRLRPLVLVGEDGRYLGLVRIEKLLEALAARCRIR
jgi:hypothetical protein